jgi:hypothetical protein
MEQGSDDLYLLCDIWTKVIGETHVMVPWEMGPKVSKVILSTTVARPETPQVLSYHVPRPDIPNVLDTAGLKCLGEWHARIEPENGLLYRINHEPATFMCFVKAL